MIFHPETCARDCPFAIVFFATFWHLKVYVIDDKTAQNSKENLAFGTLLRW